MALALCSLYLLWGSTPLAIRVAVETLPPLLMGGLRWLLSGLVLLGVSLVLEGRAWPGRAALRHAALTGFLTITVGNGAVTWAETRVSSGLAAVGLATVSLWMVLLEWLRPGGQRPRGAVLLGVVLGLGGVALLGGVSGRRADPLGLALVLLAALSWSVGAFLQRRAQASSSGAPMPRADGPLRRAALQMLCGGAALALGGVLGGEAPRLSLAAASARSLGGAIYLVIAGSLLGYTIFQWLLRHSSAALASTYACVNPLIAVLLGWLVADERYGGPVLATAALIISSVALIVTPPGVVAALARRLRARAPASELA